MAGGCHCVALWGLAFFAACCPLPLAYFAAPYPPQPPSPAGKGEIQSLFRRGRSPRHPCIRPFAAPTATAKRAPRGQNPRGTGYPCRCGALRGACFVCRPPTLPLACFLSPYPPSPPSPAGKGEIQSLFRRGLRPRHPCIRPFAAPTATAKRVPRGQNPRGTAHREPLPVVFAATTGSVAGMQGAKPLA